MSKVNLMTQAQYAKHRGCSAVAVHKAINAGRITLIDGKIDPTVADIQWAQNTRARASLHRPGNSGAGSAEGTGNGAADRPAETIRDGDYWDARGRREAAEAAIAEMKEAEMRGSLIRADSVRSALAAKIAATRDALLQIPARMSPVLAAEMDSDRIVELLEDELRQALAQLSQADTMEKVV
jgi:hypothetical protein